MQSFMYMYRLRKRVKDFEEVERKERGGLVERDRGGGQRGWVLVQVEILVTEVEGVEVRVGVVVGKLGGKGEES